MRTHSEFLPRGSEIRPGLRVLVVEDSFMVAIAIAAALEDLGARVVGPASTVRSAMGLLDQGPCDGAVLDINLGEETSEGIARRLDQDGVPFIFVSGYQRPLGMLKDEGLRARRLLAKPVDDEELRQAIREDFLGSPASPPRP
ncbi:MAG TPA: response regulator [Phycisphaerales bacterium]|nr:response regulator [Phycisphaerales bacterium]